MVDIIVTRSAAIKIDKELLAGDYADFFAAVPRDAKVEVDTETQYTGYGMSETSRQVPSQITVTWTGKE